MYLPTLFAETRPEELHRIIRRHPWACWSRIQRSVSMSDAPADYLAEQLRQIVGIEIELTRMEGKRKLSQNRDLRDFEGTVHALEERGHSELAAAMKQS